MSRKIDIVKHNVKILVEKNPEVKDCYNLLIIKYWEIYELAQNLEDAKHCTPAETITRAFRSLLKTGEISVGQVTKEIRRNKRNEFYNYYIQEVQK